MASIKEKLEKIREFLLKIKIKPMVIIALSFLLVILVGAIFLSLAFTHTGNVNINFLDALFTSTSATCVTGLFSIPGGCANAFNLAGRIIIGILIQLGGIGVTTLGAIVFVVISHKLSFGEQSLIKENWNLQSFKSIRFIFLQVVIVTFCFELFGALISFLDFYYIHHFGLNESIGYAIFHSVSSYNNAGFDLFGSNSLVAYENDVLLNLITSFLIIAGGIGYFVVLDMIHKKFRFRKFTLQAKIALTYSLSLIFIGWLAIYLSEFNNKSNVGAMGSFFMSVSTRTAGFTTYDLSVFRSSTLIIMIVLMFIGASPGGTGGGIKTTTFALLFAYLRGILTDKRPYLFKRSIDKKLVRKALLIILLGVSFVTLGVILICAIEGDELYLLNDVVSSEYVENATLFSAMDHAFEAMSAFGTVGLSTGFTPYYHSASKIILIVLMYVGRLGPFTISTLFKGKNKQGYRFAEESVAIG